MKQDLEKMMQEAPTLTLEPFAEEKPAETVKQEEVKKADEKENLRAILSPGEQEQVEAFVKQIDVTNSQLVLQYGASAQKKIADFSEAALGNVRSIIKIQNGGIRETFTVRRVAYGVGVERTFPMHAPIIEKIEVTRRGKVRRARLFYLRDRVGKAAKVKELKVR